MSYNDVAALKTRFTQWADTWEACKNAPENYFHVPPPGLEKEYQDLMRKFDETEDRWRWLMGCRAELEENPDVLAEWALEQEARLK